MTPELIADFDRFSQRALTVGVAGLALCGVGWFLNPDQFYRAYLVGFLFWNGVALGCLAIAMLHQLSGGAWGVVIRRVLEASTRTLPLLLILFVPVVIGLRQIYPWTNAEEMSRSIALQQKAAHYLNPSFFTARAVGYFAIWSVLALLLNWFSLQQDRTADPKLRKRMQFLSGPGLVIFVLTTTFAAIDWVMSLDPAWSSTIFGLIFVASWTLSALGFTILAMSWLSQREPMNRVLQPWHFHDLGNLTLTLVMLWTYFAFSQYLIIWSGNLPEETVWYVARKHGGWGVIALSIAILQFAFPFLLLLSRATKESARKLAMLAVLILVMRAVDVIWLIEPTYNPARFHLSWMDVVAPIGMGGLWLATFAWQLQKRSLVPINDPQLEAALEAHAGH